MMKFKMRFFIASVLFFLSFSQTVWAQPTGEGIVIVDKVIFAAKVHFQQNPDSFTNFHSPRICALATSGVQQVGNLKNWRAALIDSLNPVRELFYGKIYQKQSIWFFFIWKHKADVQIVKIGKTAFILRRGCKKGMRIVEAQANGLTATMTNQIPFTYSLKITNEGFEIIPPANMVTRTVIYSQPQ